MWFDLALQWEEANNNVSYREIRFHCISRVGFEFSCFVFEFFIVCSFFFSRPYHHPLSRVVFYDSNILLLIVSLRRVLYFCYCCCCTTFLLFSDRWKWLYLVSIVVAAKMVDTLFPGLLDAFRTSTLFWLKQVTHAGTN